jgi:hypothetical protein
MKGWRSAARRVLKLLLVSACLAVCTAGRAYAQASPPSTASASIGGKTITIRYSAPSVRGRKIFGDGGLLSRDPTYPAWRAGANAATTLSMDADLDVAGLAVPRGTYSLYVWVKDPDAWQLIVNKQTGQSGLDYSARQDLGRVKMTMSKPPTLVERLKYTLTDKGANKGELRLEWENHAAVVPITVK